MYIMITFFLEDASYSNYVSRVSNMYMYICNYCLRGMGVRIEPQVPSFCCL